MRADAAAGRPPVTRSAGRGAPGSRRTTASRGASHPTVRGRSPRVAVQAARNECSVEQSVFSRPSPGTAPGQGPLLRSHGDDAHGDGMDVRLAAAAPHASLSPDPAGAARGDVRSRASAPLYVGSAFRRTIAEVRLKPDTTAFCYRRHRPDIRGQRAHHPAAAPLLVVMRA